MKFHVLLASLSTLSFVRRSFASFIALALIAASFSHSAKGAAYTFTNIADSSGIFAPATNNLIGIGTAPLSLNNIGTVAFSSRLDDNSRGTFTGNGISLQPIALTSGPVFNVVDGASINSTGAVAFWGVLDSGAQGVFRSDGGQITTVALDTEPTFSTFASPVINDAGTVAFSLRFTDGSRGILSRNGGSTTMIAAASDPNFSGIATNIAINSAGTVAFKGFLENGQGGYFTSNGGAPTTITLATLLPDGVSINDAGNVTFIFGGGVYVGNGGGLATVADTSGPFAGFGQFSSINNSGQVAFVGNLDSGGGGIFTGPNPVADKVILMGETLFGSPVARLNLFPIPSNEVFGNIDINDFGQIAFHYELANGRQGIALATPVPEPSSVLLVILALGSMAASRRLLPINLASLRRFSFVCRSFASFLSLALIAASFSHSAKGAAYTFTNIADSSGIFAPATNNLIGIGTASLSLNNVGTVAFSSRLDDNSRGTFTGNGISLQPIALTSGPVFSIVDGASINSAGTVAFFGILDSGAHGLFTSTGGQITSVALSTEPTFSTFGWPAVNDSGTMVFNVAFTNGSRGILRRNGSATTTIALEGGSIFQGLGENLSINSAGTVSFKGVLQNGQGGYFTSSGGETTTIAIGSLFPDGTSINDAGYVTAIFGGGVYVGSGGPLTSVANTSGSFAGFGRYSSINNFGEVAFYANLDNGSSGIFTGPDPIANKVTQTGENLFGSTVTRLNLFPIPSNEIFGNVDINDFGQIAFHYELANGQQGIALATPVPEPSSVLLVILALGSMAASRRLLPINLASLRRFSFVCRSFASFISLALIAASFSCSAKGAAYTFTAIADTSSGFFAPTGSNTSGIGTAELSLNNSGTVAFRSFLRDGSTGVFVGNGSSIQTVALSNDPIFSVVVGASINSVGTVAFRGTLESGVRGVFISNGGQLTTVALNTEPTYASFLAPVINDAGTVAFNVEFTDGSRGIVARRGGATTAIASESAPIFQGLGGNLDINASETVPFFGQLENGQFGIFSGNGGPPTTLVLGNAFRDGASINNAGSVAFNDRDGAAVYVRSSSGLVVVAGTNGPFSRFGNYSSINNFGQVAFLANLDSGGGGLFTGGDPLADQVIRIGDPLFGSTLTRLNLFPIPANEIFGDIDINDLGQVAFHYELADSRQGIALATPTPELSVFLLVVSAVGSLAASRRLRLIVRS